MTLSAYDVANVPIGELMVEAARLRSVVFENRVDLCAIVNIKSGCCGMDCGFCAQSVHHRTGVEVYPLRNPSELVESTQNIWREGVGRVGWVSSGCRLSGVEVDVVLSAAEILASGNQSNLPKNHTENHVENHADNCPKNSSGKLCCASFGQLDSQSLKRLKSAGFAHYHHNLETSERFYPSICTTQKWTDRLATLNRVLELGWEVCSGGIFGLGETWEDRIQLAQTLKNLNVKSVPLNFYNPITGTPLAGVEKLGVEEGLRIIALFRIMLPDASIRICGGRPKIFAGCGEKLFQAGADSLMTGNYLTTNGITPEQDKKMITKAGFTF
ncbi:MAG: biotin synthase BioB [Planctomycetaceae bacterium]|jgi:biotin synthase|nr:biotin synthase BioB [Planctomycetaceae bacterium]